MVYFVLVKSYDMADQWREELSCLGIGQWPSALDDMRALGCALSTVATGILATWCSVSDLCDSLDTAALAPSASDKLDEIGLTSILRICEDRSDFCYADTCHAPNMSADRREIVGQKKAPTLLSRLLMLKTNSKPYDKEPTSLFAFDKILVHSILVVFAGYFARGER